MAPTTRMFVLRAAILAGLWLGGAARQPVAADDALAPLDVRQIRVGGEIGRRIDVTVNNNLLVLNADKDFLAPFSARTARSGYIGLGKLIDAAVRFAAYTKNEKVIALKKHLVDAIIADQQPDGYIGMMAPQSRMWGAWDIHEMGYLAFGLTNDYHYFAERRSLEAARKVADYVIERWSTMPADWPQRENVATNVLVTGLERTLLTLYRESKDLQYLNFTVKQRALPQWDLGIVIGRRALIEGHAYAYLARCLAQLELYRDQPQASLLAPAHRAVHFLTAQDGMAITGAAGQAEIWTDDQDGRNALGETCTTAYQLRVYDSLLRLEGNPRYGDLMERTIYNTLFAAQSPDGRKIRYFSPFEGKREYHSTDTYCCPCNYRRIVAELPAMVYYQAKGGLAVNLYTPSQATVRLDDGLLLKIRQETDYPTSGRVLLRLDPSKPAALALQLRIPRWCGKAAASVNGQPIAAPIAPGAFLTIRRIWKAGDQVLLDMAMPWRLVAGRKRQAGRAAVMRGPVVFCLNPAQNASLRGQDGADLGFLMIDPASLKVVPDKTVRPDGIACELKAGSDWSAVGCAGNLALRLTEFPDPEGKCTYFRLPDPAVAVPDELVGDVEAGR